MITLPLYVIEKEGSVWTLYNTETCEMLYFETKEKLDKHLKKLKL